MLTTFTEPFNRVSMHGVRTELVEAQARSVGLPLHRVEIPSPCSNSEYESRMAAVTSRFPEMGVEAVVFGDLFLEDVRRYRERQLAGSSVQPIFPLWGRKTGELVAEMLDAGLRTVLVCVDPRRMPEDSVGQWLTPSRLADLPPGVDPCGENGEFHTFVADGPMFSYGLDVEVGERVVRDGFAFADLTLRR